MAEYLTLFAIILAVNLLPAFGPPTWSVLVLYGLNSDLPIVPTVLAAALAAAAGRLLLALAFRHLGMKIPAKMQRNLIAARHTFERRKQAGFIALALFALSPLPSAQLFEAAGLTRVRLVPFTLAFFSGRVVSYSIYWMGARAIRSETLAEAFWQQLQSPLGIMLQLAMIAALIALVRFDWERLARPKTSTGRTAGPGSDP